MARLRLILSFVLSILAAPAMATVAVTSVTAGDPLGQPPAQQERILRVGTDIQANERITTKENDRAHIVFVDGTAITVGPNSNLVIDQFVYDPDKATGTLSVTNARGVMRLVGGKLTKSGDVTVKTPSSSMGIRGGIAIVEVSPTGATHATFLFGESLTVKANGKTEIATRPGSLIQVEPGHPPSLPTIVPIKGLSNAALEKPAGPSTATGTSAKAGAVEAAFERSQFSAGNSKVAPQVHDQHTPLVASHGSAKHDSAPHIVAITRLQTIAHRVVTQHTANTTPPRRR